MAKLAPSVAFLGFAERAAYVRDGNTNLFKWNVIGLKHIFLFPIFPISLTGWNIGRALYQIDVYKETSIVLTNEAGDEVGKINVSAKAAEEPQETIAGESMGLGSCFLGFAMYRAERIQEPITFLHESSRLSSWSWVILMRIHLRDHDIL